MLWLRLCNLFRAGGSLCLCRAPLVLMEHHTDTDSCWSRAVGRSETWTDTTKAWSCTVVFAGGLLCLSRASLKSFLPKCCSLLASIKFFSLHVTKAEDGLVEWMVHCYALAHDCLIRHHLLKISMFRNFSQRREGIQLNVSPHPSSWLNCTCHMIPYSIHSVILPNKLEQMIITIISEKEWHFPSKHNQPSEIILRIQYIGHFWLAFPHRLHSICHTGTALQAEHHEWLLLF